MSLPHFFGGVADPGEILELGPDDARHAAGSLRLRIGDRLTSSDGRGGLVVGRIVRAARDALVVEVEERTVAAWPRPAVRVLLAPPKGERLAWAVQKLTEVGVDAIVLVEAGRSVRRWTGERAAKAAERMAAVAREAAKQSRRRFLPEVSGPLPWEQALGAALDLGPVAVLWEGAGAGLLEVLPREPPETISLVVGPEGGIPEEDARSAADRGALLAGLGPTILRSETAALAGAVVTLSRFGRLDGPAAAAD
jgi:16S rRNA (uracil1498-N3)-methyltransferase